MATNSKNPDLLKEIVEAAERASGASVCIYDLRNFLGERHGSTVEGYRIHDCAFCQTLHTLPGGLRACVESDTQATVALAEEYRRPFFNTCHAGLTEIVVPVLRHNELIAVAFCGQARLRGETRWETVLSRIRSFHPDPLEFERYFMALPVTDRQTLSATATLLDLSLRYLVEATDRWMLEYLMVKEPYDPIAKALLFVENHYHEGISARDVAEHVHLNPSYLARLFKKQLGHTITEHITRVRIERARVLCTETSIPLHSIASNVGYTSYVHFANMFRRVTGISPSKFRATHTT